MKNKMADTVRPPEGNTQRAAGPSALYYFPVRNMGRSDVRLPESVQIAVLVSSDGLFAIRNLELSDRLIAGIEEFELNALVSPQSDKSNVMLLKHRMSNGSNLNFDDVAGNLDESNARADARDYAVSDASENATDRFGIADEVRFWSFTTTLPHFLHLKSFSSTI